MYVGKVGEVQGGKIGGVCQSCRYVPKYLQLCLFAGFYVVMVGESTSSEGRRLVLMLMDKINSQAD